MAEEKIIEAKVQPEEYIVQARIVGWKPLGILDNHNYNKLFNKPKINGVELVGDKSTADLHIDKDIEDAVDAHNRSFDPHTVMIVTSAETNNVLDEVEEPARDKWLDTKNALVAIRNWAKGKIKELKDLLTGTEKDGIDEITLWGLRNRTDKYVKDVIGDQSNSVDDVTIWGVRNRSDKHASDIIGTEKDPDTAKTINGLFKKDISNFNKLDSKIDSTKSELLGSSSDAPGKTTINGALNKASQVQNVILGARTDDGSKLTLYGLSKKVEDAQNAVTGKSTDSEDDLTLNGLKKRIMIHGTDANKSIQDLTKMIDENTKSIELAMGTDPDSTDDESIYGLRNNLYKLRKDTFGNQDDDTDVMTLNGINNRLNALFQVINGDDDGKTAGNLKSIAELTKEITKANESIDSVNTDISQMKEHVANNLTTTEEGWVLDARMGKVLADKIPNQAELDKTVADFKKTGDETIAELKARALVKKANMTLAASGWSGTAVPYAYDLGETYAASFCVVDFDGGNGNVDQLSVFVKANVHGSNSTKLYAFGTKPTADIPVVITYT